MREHAGDVSPGRQWWGRARRRVVRAVEPVGTRLEDWSGVDLLVAAEVGALALGEAPVDVEDRGGDGRPGKPFGGAERSGGEGAAASVIGQEEGDGVG